MTKRNLPGEFPKAYQKLVEAIDHEVSWLHVIWRNYRQLFGAEPQNVELLNQVAPAFARLIQDSLLHDVLLHLSRLTDPASSGKNKDGTDRENLSLDQLKPVAASSGDPEMVKQLRLALKKTKESCDVLRVHRNKRLAHADLNVALEGETLPGFSRQTIEDALKELRELMNDLNLHYRGGPTSYEHTIVHGEADSILHCLRDGLRLRRLRRRLSTTSDEDLRRQIADRRVAGELEVQDDHADEEDD